MAEKAPLEIKQKLVGKYVTRIMLNSGSYVVAHMDGRYTCIHSSCVGRGEHALKCEHVQFVRDHDGPDANETTNGGEVTTL